MRELLDELDRAERDLAEWRNRDRFVRWIARNLPRRVVYYATIRVIVEATNGKYSDDKPSELTAFDALKRWNSRD